jgi:hypothetical protein
MNEASNFCEGEICTLMTTAVGKSPEAPMKTAAPVQQDRLMHVVPTNCETQCKQPSPGSKVAYPPYAIHNLGHTKAALGSKAMPMSARHVDGQLQYNTHNLYGLSEAAATRWALQQITGKRPFILTRWVRVEFCCQALALPARARHMLRSRCLDEAYQICQEEQHHFRSLLSTHCTPLPCYLQVHFCRLRPSCSTLDW